MRTLILMRHANAKSNSPTGDRGRELSERGWQEARAAGELLRGKGIQHVLCSSAARTRQTLEALGLPAADDGGPAVEYMEALYLGSTEVMRQRISEIPDEVQVLLVVGHAPSIPHLSSQLAWESDHRTADRLQCWFPTSTYTEVSIDGTWADLGQGEASARLEDVQRPAGR